MVTNINILYKKEVKMLPAQSLKELLSSIKDGCFSKDGSKLKVVGDFNVKDKNISSLSGAPKEIEYDFDCSYNGALKTLEGGPEKVGGDYNCANNISLESLVGASQELHGHFWCFNNPKLKNLEGAPKKIGSDFYCTANKLESLKGCPKTVGGNLYCSNNELLSLEGCPPIVGGLFECVNNHLTSLESIHMHIHEIGDYADFEKNPIKSHVLGLLKIKGLKKVFLDNREVQNIINKYLLGDISRTPSIRDIVDCQEELMDNDFEDYALL